MLDCFCCFIPCFLILVDEQFGQDILLISIDMKYFAVNWFKNTVEV